MTKKWRSYVITHLLLLFIKKLYTMWNRYLYQSVDVLYLFCAHFTWGLSCVLCNCSRNTRSRKPQLFWKKGSSIFDLLSSNNTLGIIYFKLFRSAHIAFPSLHFVSWIVLCLLIRVWHRKRAEEIFLYLLARLILNLTFT